MILNHSEEGRNRLWVYGGEGGAYRNVRRVVPLPEAVVEAHVEPRLPDAVGEVAGKVTLGTQVDAVPVPVV